MIWVSETYWRSTWWSYFIYLCIHFSCSKLSKYLEITFKPRMKYKHLGVPVFDRTMFKILLVYFGVWSITYKFWCCSSHKAFVSWAVLTLKGANKTMFTVSWLCLPHPFLFINLRTKALKPGNIPGICVVHWGTNPDCCITNYY